MTTLQSILPVSRKALENLRSQYESKLQESRRELSGLRKEQRMLRMRAFAAAQVNRLTEDFSTTWININKDIRQGGRALVSRARDLCQNNAHAKRLMQLYMTNVIGSNGPTFQPNVVEQTIETAEGRPKVKLVPDVLANTKILEAWMDWIEPGNCTIDGRHSFAGFCKLAGASKARDGEAIIRKIIEPKAKHPLKLQIIPVDAIDYELNGKTRTGNAIIMGVEVNVDRRPVAYWVRKAHPETDLYGIPWHGDHQRIPAEQVIHWFDQEYYNQVRGITRFAQIMLPLHETQRYENAVVTNATVSANKLGFFADKSPESEEELVGDKEDAEGNVVIEAEAGTFQDIGNKEFHAWDPKFPTEQHEMFVRAQLRKIAAGWGCAYSSLANDYGTANYSSLRAELLVERENWKAEQQSFIDHVLKPIFSAWLNLEITVGNIALPMTKFDKFNKPVFVGPRWKWVDPLKDVQAARLSIDSGFASPFDIVAENGESSLEQIYADIEEALELARKHRLKLNFSESQSAAKMLAEEEDAQPKPAPSPAAGGEEDEEDRADLDVVAALAGTNGNGHSKG